MPDIHKATVAVGDGADEVRATVVTPDSAPRGSIVLLHTSRAFSPAMLDFMHELADERWLVVAPEAGAADVSAEIETTFGWIETKGISLDRVGLLGFDDAGTAVVRVAADRPIGALVSVSPPSEVAGGIRLVDLTSSLRAPWLVLYGDDDPRTPPQEAEALRDAMGGADAPALVVSYEGLAHRPDEPPVERESVEQPVDVVEAATVDARRRIFDWFDTHLR